MRKKRRLGTLLLVLAMSLTIGVTVFGVSYHYSVDTSQYYYITSAFTTEEGTTLSVDTRPSSGNAGVSVLVDAGSIYSGTQIFPYQVDREPWLIPMQKNIFYSMSIKSRSGIAEGVFDFTMY